MARLQKSKGPRFNNELALRGDSIGTPRERLLESTTQQSVSGVISAEMPDRSA